MRTMLDPSKLLFYKPTCSLCVYLLMYCSRFVLYRYLGTGWKFHRYNASAVSGVNASLPWTEDGAWADCDPRANMTFTIPGDNAYHNITKTFHIDPGLVGEWLEDGGARNYGVLLRAAEGSVAMMGSAGAEIHAGQKAALRIKYSSNADGGGAVEESYPVTYTNAPRVIWVDAAAGNDVTGSGSSLYPYASPAKALFEAWPGDVINMRSGVYQAHCTSGAATSLFSQPRVTGLSSHRPCTTRLLLSTPYLSALMSKTLFFAGLRLLVGFTTA